MAPSSGLSEAQLPSDYLRRSPLLAPSSSCPPISVDPKEVLFFRQATLLLHFSLSHHDNPQPMISSAVIIRREESVIIAPRDLEGSSYFFV